MLGEYQELDNELYMISSVRSLDGNSSAKSIPPHIFSQQNQQFNIDDIDELKKEQILGETSQGELRILPPGIGLVNQASIQKRQLASILVKEENHDRNILWKHTIATKDNLTNRDLKQLKESYAKQIFQASPTGMWFLQSNNKWLQKVDIEPESSSSASGDNEKL